jgi:hypothetical protein
LKLEEKRNELRPSNQNCVVKIPGEAVFRITQKYDLLPRNVENSPERLSCIDLFSQL